MTISSPERPRKIAHWSRAGSGEGRLEGRGWDTALASCRPPGLASGPLSPAARPAGRATLCRQKRISRCSVWVTWVSGGTSPEPCPRLGGSTAVGGRGTHSRRASVALTLELGDSVPLWTPVRHLRRAGCWGLDWQENRRSPRRRRQPSSSLAAGSRGSRPPALTGEQCGSPSPRQDGAVEGRGTRDHAALRRATACRPPSAEWLTDGSGDDVAAGRPSAVSIQRPRLRVAALRPWGLARATRPPGRGPRSLAALVNRPDLPLPSPPPSSPTRPKRWAPRPPLTAQRPVEGPRRRNVRLTFTEKTNEETCCKERSSGVCRINERGAQITENGEPVTAGEPAGASRPWPGLTSPGAPPAPPARLAVRLDDKAECVTPVWSSSETVIFFFLIF